MEKRRPNTLKEYLQRWLGISLHHLALSVAARPKTYLVVPIVITCFSALGILRSEFSNDVPAMFTGSGTRMDKAFHVFKDYFEKDNDAEFYPGRIVDVKSFVRILVIMKDAHANGSSSLNILDEEPYAELLKVDAFVRELAIPTDGGPRYVDLCAHHKGQCLSSPALEIGRFLPKIRSNETELTFPIFIDDEDPLSGSIFLPGTLARPRLRRQPSAATDDDEDAVVESSPGLSLLYVLNASTPQQLERARKWEDLMDEQLPTFSSSLNHVNTYFFTASTFTRESNLAVSRMYSTLVYSAITIFIFALISGVMKDPIQSKPYFSLAGMMSAGCAIVTTWGVCALGNIPFMGLSAAVPLLLLGVGFDDTFVLLAAWRNTCKTKSAADRLADAYSEAAVSLFITTFTDAACFLIGSLTPYPGINYFCILAGVGVLLLLTYQLTLFGAMMYLMGLVECENRDALTFQRVFVANDDQETTGWRPWRCPYYLKAEDMTKTSEPYLMAFFRDAWGKLLMTYQCKIIVATLFIAYLVTSMYSAVRLESTFDRRFLTNEDTPATQYIAYEEEYFFDWPGRPMIAVIGHVDYSNKTVQKDMELLLGEVENNRFFADSLFTESWLRGFVQFVKMNEYYEKIDISTEELFVKELKGRFLADGDGGMSTDVIFNEDGTKIVASRFIVQLSNLEKFSDFSEAMLYLWRVCDSFSDRYDVRVFHPAFKWTEQNADIFSYTAMTVLSAVAFVLAISFVLIPKASVSLWITLSIISSTTGIVGCMHLWGLTLNLITMVGLVIGTGFSVDFTAHISYSYAVSEKSRPSDRMRDALYRLGLPMLQGGASTLVALIFAAFLKTYALKSLVKVMFLVITIGLVHGLVFFPVLLVLASEAAEWWSSRVLRSLPNYPALSQVIARHTNSSQDNNEPSSPLEVVSGGAKVPVIHLACERGYFKRTVQQEIFSGSGGCCGDLISPSDKARLSTVLTKNDREALENDERDLQPEPVLFVPGTSETGGDKLIFYPALIVLSRTDSPQMEAKFSSVPAFDLSNRAAMIAAVNSVAPTESCDRRVGASAVTLGTMLGNISGDSSLANSPRLSNNSSIQLNMADCGAASCSSSDERSTEVDEGPYDSQQRRNSTDEELV